MEDILTMNQKELQRLHVTRKAIDKCIKQHEAAVLLNLSERQIRRLVQRVRKESDKGIIHRSRGKVSHRAMADPIRKRIVGLCRARYVGFSPTLASEKLFERDKISVSHETLRQWFIAEGIVYQKRTARPHRSWRQRRAHCGEMVQMDGSHHNWFEGRGSPCVLMGYIDDATSRVYARFYGYEGTFPAMDSFKRYALKHGIPASIYLDRHAAYKSKGKATVEEQLQGRGPLSEFERSLEDLGVRVIHAQSAPAKGRIERLFRTCQDRLIKEMRLEGIKDIAGANEFLKVYLSHFNKRFGVEPRERVNLHRPVSAGIDLDKALSLRTERALRNDFTIVHEGRLYQIEDTIRADKVTVEDCLNGKRLITHKGRSLRFREILQRPVKPPQPRTVYKEPFVIPQAHPWRRFRLPGSPRFKIREEATAAAL